MSDRTTPRVVLGMTLCNNARHLVSAAESLLAQTEGRFALVMLDDGSEDETESIGRAFERQDARVTYTRHERRQGMVAAWRGVFDAAMMRHPSAEYFAWVSDHDVWTPTWLATLLADLDAHPEAVLAYPLVPRIDEAGHIVDKTPRLFDTAGEADPFARWSHFCWEGFGSGDMVYGVARVSALRRAGVFRPVLNPDRLLVAELTLQGQIRQVQEPLWLRRQASTASVVRQRSTLFAGEVPADFWLPPALQHDRVFAREYRSPASGVSLNGSRRALYIFASTWRGYRKTETSKRFGRGIDNLHLVKKLVKKAVHASIYTALVTMHALAGKARRLWRKVVYEVAMMTHRLGLRAPRKESGPR